MVAIVFMKMHSDRVPNKNIQKMCGKPLFYWVINTLLKVSGLSKVYVDTDSPVIKHQVQQEFGTEITVFDRDESVRGDEVTANHLIANMLTRIDDNHILMTHVTNPLLKPKTIEKAIEEYWNYREFGCDSLLSVNEHQSNFYSLFGEPINHDPRIVEMSQKRLPMLEENSNLYIFSRETFCKYGRVGLNPRFFAMNKLESIDIDTPEDWVLAEAILVRN